MRIRIYIEASFLTLYHKLGSPSIIGMFLPHAPQIIVLKYASIKFKSRDTTLCPNEINSFNAETAGNIVTG
jgi:hypothetical protein